ncbi:hypothetical protein N9955_00325 [bacterium]|nr:hypothetical protein [bacterium]
MKIKVQKEDIFDYVVGNSQYDAIEKHIDPIRYEVFDCGIYDNDNQKLIKQDECFESYCKFVSDLRVKAVEMTAIEIEKLCIEIAEIAPNKIKLR